MMTIFNSQIVTRRKNIHEKSEKRRELLEESRKLQQFEKEADETKAWINEKLKIATDESYKVEHISLIQVVDSIYLPMIPFKNSIRLFPKSHVIAWTV